MKKVLLVKLQLVGGKMNINLQCPINSLGYGQTGFHLLKAMENSGLFETTLFPIGNIVYKCSDLDKTIIGCCIDRQNMYDPLAPSLLIWHQFDMAKHIGKGERIGFPIFELNKFTSRELWHLSALDRVFVCSDWAKEVVEDCSSIKTSVIPLGVDTSIFNPKPKKRKDGKIVFLNIGKWEIRKGHDILLSAFQKAFKGRDDVELWMMNHNPFLSEQQTKQWVKPYAEDSRVKLLGRVETQQEVAAIMNEADFGIFPSRAEGWNLEALEMLACGKWIGITDYSAHTQFCSDKNSILIKPKGLEPAWDGIWFDGMVGNWASVTVDSVAEVMYNLLQSKTGVENAEGIKTAKMFSWENSAKELYSELNS